jgi:DNA repair exonuclease SbcCD ATPase subunit
MNRVITIAAFSGQDIAIPNSNILGLVHQLACDTTAYRHLKGYLQQVDGLKAVGTDSLQAALAQVQHETQAFGSPKVLRQCLSSQPNPLADQMPPDLLYTALVWLVQQLHLSSALIITALQTLAREARSHQDVKEGLLRLGRNADKARQPIAALIVRLRAFKPKLLLANHQLSEAYRANTTKLHSKQERLGTLKVTIENLQQNIAKLNFLSSAQTRKKLSQELEALQQELQALSTETDQLRRAIAAVELVLEEGAWIPTALDDITGFLENLRKLWTTFGTNLTQMAADATAAQLGDLNWVKKGLGLGKAIDQWTLISQVAKQFVVDALVDGSSN